MKALWFSGAISEEKNVAFVKHKKLTNAGKGEKETFRMRRNLWKKTLCCFDPGSETERKWDLWYVECSEKFGNVVLEDFYESKEKGSADIASRLHSEWPCSDQFTRDIPRTVWSPDTKFYDAKAKQSMLRILCFSCRWLEQCSKEDRNHRMTYWGGLSFFCVSFLIFCRIELLGCFFVDISE